MNRWTRPIQRTREVWLPVPLTESETEWVHRNIPSEFASAFFSMHPADQRHCLQVGALCHHWAMNHGLNEAEEALLVQAALLHDVGKAKCKLSIWIRVLHALSLPTMFQRGLAGILPRGREQLRILQNHASLGGEILDDLGADPTIVHLVGNHHDKNPTDLLGTLLKRADEEAG